MEKIKTISALISTIISATAVADTNPCYTQLFRVFYPQGKENGVQIYGMITPNSNGVELKIFNQSFAYYDLTFRSTTVAKGATNSTTETRPMVSAQAAAAIGLLNPEQPTGAQKAIVVPWSNLCNLRGNSGQIEMWICEPGKTNVLSYGIVRVDGN